jgi:release factor glutamine methyltransferase
MTPRMLLLDAARRLKEAEIPDPQVDGALLLSHLTGKRPLELRLDSDTQLDEETLDRFEALLARREKREPLQYLTGEADFLGRVFYVDARVLIPRPETELLAEKAVQALKGFDAPRTALDLCCGSGCLGVTLALEAEDASVTLTDLSADALEVAKNNAARLGAKATFMQGDLFEALQGKQFQVIVSNPPYIPREECDTLQPEVRREPLMALAGGADGLDFYRRIAAEAPAHLMPGGEIMLEVGWNQAAQVAKLLQDAGMTEIRIDPDMQGIPRMVMARKTR